MHVDLQQTTIKGGFSIDFSGDKDSAGRSVSSLRSVLGL